MTRRPGEENQETRRPGEKTRETSRPDDQVKRPADPTTRRPGEETRRPDDQVEETRWPDDQTTRWRDQETRRDQEWRDQESRTTRRPGEETRSWVRRCTPGGEPGSSTDNFLLWCTALYIPPDLTHHVTFDESDRFENLECNQSGSKAWISIHANVLSWRFY